MKHSPDRDPSTRASFQLGRKAPPHRRYKKGVKGITFFTRDIPPSRYSNYRGYTFDELEEDGYRATHFIRTQVAAGDLDEAP